VLLSAIKERHGKPGLSRNPWGESKKLALSKGKIALPSIAGGNTGGFPSDLQKVVDLWPKLSDVHRQAVLLSIGK
jgi:hypothetical protein